MVAVLRKTPELAGNPQQKVDPEPISFFNSAIEVFLQAFKRGVTFLYISYGRLKSFHDLFKILYKQSFIQNFFF